MKGELSGGCGDKEGLDTCGVFGQQAHERLTLDHALAGLDQLIDTGCGINHIGGGCPASAQLQHHAANLLRVNKSYGAAGRRGVIGAVGMVGAARPRRWSVSSG